ncbi:MAG: DUF423 domain-containing protein [Nitrospinaceae bacterium]
MRIWLRWGGILGGLSVLFGAFGAHSLKNILTPERLHGFQTAVQYQFFHSLALILVGLLAAHLGAEHAPRVNRAGKFFLAGILLFCGSIYALTLGGPRFFGPLTPIGGLCFMTGWFLLAFSLKKK